METEQPKKNNLGGKRPGAGLKKGYKFKSTITKEASLQAFKERIHEDSLRLYNAAKSVALGQMYVYRIDEETGPKGGKIKKHVLVTDPDEIQEALDQMEGNGYGDNYYYTTTKDPDIRAIDSLISRAYGKPSESLDITSGGEKVVSFNYIPPKEDDNI